MNSANINFQTNDGDLSNTFQTPVLSHPSTRSFLPLLEEDVPEGVLQRDLLVFLPFLHTLAVVGRAAEACDGEGAHVSERCLTPDTVRELLLLLQELWPHITLAPSRTERVAVHVDQTLRQGLVDDALGRM